MQQYNNRGYGEKPVTDDELEEEQPYLPFEFLL